MINLLRRRKRQAPPVVVKQVPSSQMTISDWKKSPEHVAWAIRMNTDPFFRDLLCAFTNTRPTPVGTSDYRLGALDAWYEAGRVLKTLNVPAVQPVTEPDYTAEEEED